MELAALVMQCPAPLSWVGTPFWFMVYKELIKKKDSRMHGGASNSRAEQLFAGVMESFDCVRDVAELVFECSLSDIPHHFCTRVTAKDELGRARRPTTLGSLSFRKQDRSVAAADATVFDLAVARINNDPNGIVDAAKLETDLSPILSSINKVQLGHTEVDLRLIALGSKFGKMTKAGLFITSKQAASWLERNLSAIPPNPGVAPGRCQLK